MCLSSPIQVPTLNVDDKRSMFGSQVILQYIDSIAPADKQILPPTTEASRCDELVLESLADSILDAALLCRYEVAVRVSFHHVCYRRLLPILNHNLLLAPA